MRYAEAHLSKPDKADNLSFWGGDDRFVDPGVSNHRQSRIKADIDLSKLYLEKVNRHHALLDYI